MSGPFLFGEETRHGYIEDEGNKKKGEAKAKGAWKDKFSTVISRVDSGHYYIQWWDPDLRFADIFGSEKDALKRLTEIWKEHATK